MLNSRLASSDGPGNLRMAEKGKERSFWLCSEPREQLLLGYKGVQFVAVGM